MIATSAAPVKTVGFNNLQIAFADKSDSELTRAYWLFRAMSSNTLVNNGPALLNVALTLRLPVTPIIRATLFKHFCGGIDISDCNYTIAKLWKSGIGSVLDYSVEGEEREENFEQTTSQILLNIDRAKGDHSIPFTVFKMTGIAGMSILEKVSSGKSLSNNDREAYDRVQKRVERICSHAAAKDVRIFIDAEETWIQQPIDDMADAMMEQFNRKRAIVFNTVQLYRTDRLEFLKASHRKAREKGYILGMKLVRGAYMEKERERAIQIGYPSPIHPDHASTNRCYDDTVTYCMEHLGEIEFCNGTHNEESCHLMIRLMAEKNIPVNHPACWFSQLLGMSDHISYNLAAAGYNVAKYVPYGPVKSVLPYLIRRAQENTSIAGQTGRELRMILEEKKRRRN